jgi:cysteine desulfurase
MRIGQTLYLDHQATTPLDPSVFSEMQPYLDDRFGNPHSRDHSAGWDAFKAVERSSRQLADLIGADPDEIVFTSGATESNNLAVLGSCRGNTDAERNRVLLSSIEHKSVLAVGRALHSQLGLNISLLPVDNEGRVIISELNNLLGDDVLIVSVMAVNNEIGTIQDIETISESIRSVGAMFHCDAAQAPLACDLTYFADAVDLLSLSSHKMYGPKGIGALYIRRELQSEIEPLIYGGGQQNGIRSGTIPVPLCVGMGKAAEICKSSDIVTEHRRIGILRDMFAKALKNLPWEVKLNGPRESIRHPGNLNVCFKGFSAHSILGTLQPRLAASTGSACTSGIPEPSHVLKAIGLSDSDVEGSIRFSLGRGTTEEDVNEAVQHLKSTLEKLASKA